MQDVIILVVIFVLSMAIISLFKFTMYQSEIIKNLRKELEKANNEKP
jgi:hypothetical protein